MQTNGRHLDTGADNVFANWQPISPIDVTDACKELSPPTQYLPGAESSGSEIVRGFDGFDFSDERFRRR